MNNETVVLNPPAGMPEHDAQPVRIIGHLGRVVRVDKIAEYDHTPGPWAVYDNGFFYDIKVPWRGRSVVEDHSPSLCQVFYKGCDGIDGLSNARLIALAPQMKAALQKVVNECVFKDANISDDLQLEIMDLLGGA